MVALLKEPEMPVEIYNELRAKSQRENLDLGELRREWFLEQVTCDIPEVQEQEAIRDGAQQKIDELKESKGAEFQAKLNLQNRIKELHVGLAFAEEQQRRFTAEVPLQKAKLSTRGLLDPRDEFSLAQRVVEVISLKYLK